MKRREFSGLTFWSLAAACVSGAAVGQVGNEAIKTRGASDKHDSHGKGHDQLRSCAQACSDCQRECDACATHCANLLSEGKKEHMTTLMSCHDCADFCTAAAQIVARGGPFAALICESCAEACGRCGQECEKFPDSAPMSRCAQECRRCEKACREMIKHGVPATKR
jgi:hypothetical protein